MSDFTKKLEERRLGVSEDTLGRIDRRDADNYLRRHYFNAGARAALKLAAEECDASAAWSRGEIPKARAARDLTTENMRHMEDHINTHLAQKLRTLAAEIGGS